VSTITTPAIIHKNSINLILDGPFQILPEEAKENQTKVNVEFCIDCTSAVNITAFWDVAKEDIHQLSPVLRYQTENEKNSKKNSSKNLYEKISAATGGTALELEEIELSGLHNSFLVGELPCHFSLKTSSIRLEEGLKQNFVLDESERVDLSELIGFIEHADTFPLVLVVSPSDMGMLEEDSQAVLICPVEIVLTKQDEQVTGVNANLKNQYILTNTKFNELQDVFGIDDDEECVICLTEPKDTTILPCNHFAVCSECFGKIETCPICRSKIEAFVRFYNESNISGNEVKADDVSSDDKLEAEIEIVEQ